MKLKDFCVDFLWSDIKIYLILWIGDERGRIRSDGKLWEPFIEQTTKLIFVCVSDMNSAFGLTIVLSFNLLKGIMKWIVEMSEQQLVLAICCFIQCSWLHSCHGNSEGIDFTKAKGLFIDVHGEMDPSSPIHSQSLEYFCCCW